MKIRYVILILIGLFLLSLLADRKDSMFNADRARWVAALNWTACAMGAAIAVASCIRLLMAAVQGAKMPQIMPAVISFFAGLSLFSVYWANSLSLAAVVICWLVVEHLRPPDKKACNEPG